MANGPRNIFDLLAGFAQTGQQALIASEQQKITDAQRRVEAEENAFQRSLRVAKFGLEQRRVEALEAGVELKRKGTNLQPKNLEDLRFLAIQRGDQPEVERLTKLIQETKFRPEKETEKPNVVSEFVDLITKQRQTTRKFEADLLKKDPALFDTGERESIIERFKASQPTVEELFEQFAVPKLISEGLSEDSVRNMLSGVSGFESLARERGVDVPQQPTVGFGLGALPSAGVTGGAFSLPELRPQETQQGQGLGELNRRLEAGEITVDDLSDEQARSVFRFRQGK